MRWTLARAMRSASGRQDDGAVHLGQLRQPLGAELGVEEEAAGADGQHVGTVADHDQERPGWPAGSGRARRAAAGPARRGPGPRSWPARVAPPPPHGTRRPRALIRPRLRRPERHRRARPRRQRRVRPPGVGPAHVQDLHPPRTVRARARARGRGGTRAAPPRPGDAGAGHLADLAGQTDLAEAPPVGGSGPPATADATARAAPGRRPGRRPRTAARPPRRTRRGDRGTPARCSSTASSRPGARRRPRWPSGGGLTIGVGTTRAWISTSRGRWPSMDAKHDGSGCPRAPVPEKQPARVGHPPRPVPVISNRPSSPVGPKRCLTDRSRRRA